MAEPGLHAARTGRRGLVLVAAVLLVVAAGVLVAWFVVGRDDGGAQGGEPEMAVRAQQVMPFDLERTTHTFTETDTGGVQTVVVDDPTDTRDRALIRAHLRAEAAAFRRGDYRDPARIHGMAMPGVAALERGARRVTVTYVDVPDGGRITYATAEPALVDALHAWFDRQQMDHGQPGMGG